MRLFLISRYSERHRLAWLRDQLIWPAGHVVVSTWIDSREDSDTSLSPAEAIAQVDRNAREMQACDAVLYLPSWYPSPGRMADVGMAVLLKKPILILDLETWEDLGWFDRTIYLRKALYCPTLASVLATLEEVGRVG